MSGNILQKQTCLTAVFSLICYIPFHQRSGGLFCFILSQKRNSRARPTQISKPLMPLPRHEMFVADALADKRWVPGESTGWEGRAHMASPHPARRPGALRGRVQNFKMSHFGIFSNCFQCPLRSLAFSVLFFPDLYTSTVNQESWAVLRPGSESRVFSP